MSKKFFVPALFAASLLAFGCEKQPAPVVTLPATPMPTPVLDVPPPTATKTLETSRLGTAIDDFVAKPTAENRAKVNEAFAKLDGEIAELQTRVAKTDGSDRSEAQAKLDNMSTYETKERARFAAASLAAPVADAMAPSPTVDDRSATQKIGDTLKKEGDKIGNTAEKVGGQIKDATKP